MYCVSMDEFLRAKFDNFESALQYVLSKSPGHHTYYIDIPGFTVATFDSDGLHFFNHLLILSK